MNELHKPYHALGMEPGAQFEIVKRRYRRLALVWHPDRMTNAEAKREAEEELKKINNNFERLKKHFETDHKPGPSCRCQPVAAGPPPNDPQGAGRGQRTNSQSGPSDAERKRQEEEAARKRTAERQRQTAEAEAAQRAAEANCQAKEKQKMAESALSDESVHEEEAFRWKCAIGIGITFIALISYCWVGCAARDLVHEIGKQWNAFQSNFRPPDQESTTSPFGN